MKFVVLNKLMKKGQLISNTFNAFTKGTESKNIFIKLHIKDFQKIKPN